MEKQRKLYVNDRLLLTIENIDDLRLDNEYEEKLTLSDYIEDVITNALECDRIYEHFDFIWEE